MSTCNNSVRIKLLSSLSLLLVSGLVTLGCSSDEDEGGTTGGSGGSAQGGTGGGTTGGTGGGTTGGTGGTTGGSGGTTGGSGGTETGGTGGGEGGAGAYTTAVVYQTSKAGDKLVDPTTWEPAAVQGGASIFPCMMSGTCMRPTINVDPEQLRQEVLGFGVSLTESSANNLNLLDAATRTDLINRMYAPHPAGAGYTMTRLHMGGCDFSQGEYTYAEPETSDLSNFSVAEDEDTIIPLTQDADAATGGVLKVVSSPWTPPPWMKDNNAYVAGNFDSAYMDIYGDYFVRYIQEYEARDIPIWAVTPQNEPAHCGEFDTCCWSAGQIADFIGTSLGPKLEAAGYGDVLILGFDHNKGTDLVSHATAAYNHATAADYTDGMAHHWYGSTIRYMEDEMDQVHTMAPDKIMLATEQSVDNFGIFDASVWFNVDDWWWEVNASDWCGCTTPEGTGCASWCTWGSDHPTFAAVYRFAEDMILDLNHWTGGWIGWNAVLDETGGYNWYGVTCSADIMVNTQSGNAIYYVPPFYVEQHFSRFMLPGGHVATTSVGAGLDLMATAALNPDNTLAVVVLNRGTEPVDYQIQIGPIPSEATEVTIPAEAIQTIVLGH